MPSYCISDQFHIAFFFKSSLIPSISHSFFSPFTAHLTLPLAIFTLPLSHTIVQLPSTTPSVCRWLLLVFLINIFLLTIIFISLRSCLELG
jgi:hypothetical protein